MFLPIPDCHLVDIVIETAEDGVNYFTTVAIAKCADTQRIITVDCALEYTTNASDVPASFWFHEFSFSISVADFLTGEAFSTQDRDIAKNYIPPDIRKVVMEIVLSSLRAMIAKIRPRAIYRVAKIKNAPGKAFEKHYSITNLLYDLGYKMFEQGTDDFGRRFWVMGKNT